MNERKLHLKENVGGVWHILIRQNGLVRAASEATHGDERRISVVRVAATEGKRVAYQQELHLRDSNEIDSKCASTLTMECCYCFSPACTVTIAEHTYAIMSVLRTVCDSTRPP